MSVWLHDTRADIWKPNVFDHKTHRSIWWENISGVPREGVTGSTPPPLEITKAFQNRAKLNPIVKTVKNCWI